MVEPYKLSCCLSTEWCYSLLIDCALVASCIQCSWCENTNMLLSITTAFSPDHACGLVVPMLPARNRSGWNVVSKAMKYVTAMTYGRLYVCGGIHKAYEVLFSKSWVPVERLGGLD